MFSLSGLFSTFRDGSARRSAVRTLGSLTQAQLRDLGIPSDSLNDFAGDMLAVTQSRRAPAIVATSPFSSVATIRNPVAAAGALQGCG